MLDDFLITPTQYTFERLHLVTDYEVDIKMFLKLWNVYSFHILGEGGLFQE